jgi:hypothetical protein
MSNPLSRRRLLARVMQISIGAALASSADAADSACVDLKKMSSDELNSRNSLHWTAKSAQADKTCAGCNFFTATSGGCGSCMILGGPTYASGYCDSWTAKQS